MPKRTYSTHGSEAYAPERLPEEPRRSRQPEVPAQPRAPRKSAQRPLTRKRVQIREADSISLDSILGFVCILCLGAVVMSGYAQLTSSADEVVQLRQELQTLSSEQLRLSAQYEKHFDIQRIEETLGDEMMRPSSEQVVYIDLSQPDAVTVYNQEKAESDGILQSIKDLFS